MYLPPRRQYGLAWVGIALLLLTGIGCSAKQSIRMVVTSSPPLESQMPTSTALKPVSLIPETTNEFYQDSSGNDLVILQTELNQAATWPKFTSRTSLKNYSFYFFHPLSWKIKKEVIYSRPGYFNLSMGRPFFAGDPGSPFPLQLSVTVVPKDDYRTEVVVDDYAGDDSKIVKPKIDTVTISGLTRPRKEYVTGYAEGGQTHDYYINLEQNDYVFTFQFTYGIATQGCATDDADCNRARQIFAETNTKIMDAIIKTIKIKPTVQLKPIP
ncbi:MAG: hypothetical protein Q7K39_01750 [Candidatus Magasanikbacteria bacterium]|nr:hypothetical protein [Candidatus Magasanikbacteria bacterium]